PAPAAPAAAPAGGESVAFADEAGVTVTTTVSVEAVVEVEERRDLDAFQAPPPARLLTAATVGDHDRRGNYLSYLARHAYEAQRLGLDMGRRQRFVVTDLQGSPLREADLVVEGPAGRVVGKTHGDGRWDYFPGLAGQRAQGPALVTVRAGGATQRLQVQLPAQGDGPDVVVRLPVQPPGRAQRLDLAFLIDVTGSMEDELRYVNQEVVGIVERIRGAHPEVAVRVGAVFYRDRSDREPLQRIRLTRDAQGFAQAMRGVHASGGGDYPEDLHAGLETAVRGLRWRADAARVLVVIADAPPQRYPTRFGHREAMLEASARGIRLLPVAASGADREVEFLFRAMATATGTPYVYLTDDSGVGNRHMEADTDRVAVEYFHDALTRLIRSELLGEGMHEPPGFG
ncbi:MAG: vWA domain-containing protein, partial [Myxococcota bacterium]